MPSRLYSQSSGYNYIVTTKKLDASGTREVKSVQYYDGLGRPTVLAAGGVNTSGKYVYIMNEYDQYGVESKQWQPAVGTTSPNIIDVTKMTSMSKATYDGDTCGYSKMKYDVLGRNVFKGTPGALWIGKGIQIEYITNEENDSVRCYSLNNGLLERTTINFYKPCSLNGVRTTDEDGHTLEVYRDLLGNVVLERRNDGKNKNDTYFVYENGLLRLVIPPLYQHYGKANVLYRYKYDDFGRCIEKVLPGNVVIKNWYDRHGRLSFMQDGLLRGKRKFRFFLYDGQNRLVVQGITSDTVGKSNYAIYDAKVELCAEKASVVSSGYCYVGNFSMPDADAELINYYDNYQGLSNFKSLVSKYNLPTKSNVCTNSLLTAQIVKTSNNDLVCRVMMYDSKGRCYSSYTTHPDGLCVNTLNSFTFTDKPTIIQKIFHKVGGGKPLHFVRSEFTYDDSSDLLLRERMQLDNLPAVTLYENTYKSPL